MRANVARCVIAVLAATILSGCTSSQWGMPNLAFWKRSPFQSSPVAAPGRIGSPVRPSAVAANDRPPASAMASTNAPAWTPPTVNVTPGTEYPSQQNPYPTTTPSYGAERVASTAGVPGANAHGTPPANPSYGNSGSYNNSYNAPPTNAASPYGGSYNSTNPSGGYPATDTSPRGYNPARPETSYPTTQPASPYGGSNGYNTAPGGYTPPAANPGNPSRYGNTPAQPKYGVGVNSNAGLVPDRVGDNDIPDNYGPSATAAPPASSYTPPTNSYAPPANGYTPPTSSYTPPSNGYAPPSGSGYTPPNDLNAPNSNYTPPTGGYVPPSASYNPPNGNVPMVGSRNSSPSATSAATGSGGYAPPASSGSSSAYRPGSTSDYAPR